MRNNGLVWHCGDAEDDVCVPAAKLPGFGD